jgi:hypothetical protein
MCMLEIGLAAGIPTMIGFYMKLRTPRAIKFFRPYNRNEKVKFTRKLDPAKISHVHELSEEQKKYYFYKGAQSVFRYGDEKNFDILATPLSAKRVRLYCLKQTKNLKDCDDCSKGSRRSNDDGR